MIVVSPLIALMKDQVQDDRIARAFCSGVLGHVPVHLCLYSSITFLYGILKIQ